MPNPWRTLARYQAQATADMPAYGLGFLFYLLQVEIIHKVTDMLLRETAACLALANRAMCQTLGT